MKVKSFFFLLFFSFHIILGQEGFNFEGNKSKIVIPFQFLNNLIIIPITVNGVELSFLLDTGGEESILFSLDETDTVSFSNIEKIKIKGFGSKEPIDGYKSTGNVLKIRDYVDFHHTLYLVLDQDINVSSQIGIPVNGIIGFNFFKNNLVKIDYVTKKIIISKNNSKTIQKIEKSYAKVPLEFYDGKPYLIAKTIFENPENILDAKLLIDTGNSDALWLFKEKNEKIKVPQNNFDDFLGKGFSGDVFGKRGRIKSFAVGNFTLNNPIAAFPNPKELAHLDSISYRLGSVGSEILRRFSVIFNYQYKTIYLKKNRFFNDPFQFNMSGIEIQHQGLQWISESYEENPSIANNLFDANGEKIVNNLKYKFELKPIYIISNIRPNSPAYLAGLQKDDIIVKINKQKTYTLSLQKINDLLKSQEGKNIEIEIERKGIPLKLNFQLKSML